MFYNIDKKFAINSVLNNFQDLPLVLYKTIKYDLKMYNNKKLHLNEFKKLSVKSIVNNTCYKSESTNNFENGKFYFKLFFNILQFINMYFI